jgi:REP element-mobilizing transposase RayT
MQVVTPLEPGQHYHIYNRGANRNDIFFEERNYSYFMQLYAKYITPVVETLAYCLMPNHFHFLVRIRLDRLGLGDRVGLNPLSHREVSQAFNNWLSAYAKSINRAYGRTGSLFQHHFGRLPVTADRYFLALVHYIHFNPQKHGLVNDFRGWPHSSYPSLLSDKPTRLERDVVLDWFGGPEGLREFHRNLVDETSIGAIIGNDAFQA